MPPGASSGETFTLTWGRPFPCDWTRTWMFPVFKVSDRRVLPAADGVAGPWSGGPGTTVFPGTPGPAVAGSGRARRNRSAPTARASRGMARRRRFMPPRNSAAPTTGWSSGPGQKALRELRGSVDQLDHREGIVVLNTAGPVAGRAEGICSEGLNVGVRGRCDGVARGVRVQAQTLGDVHDRLLAVRVHLAIIHQLGQCGARVGSGMQRLVLAEG